MVSSGSSVDCSCSLPVSSGGNPYRRGTGCYRCCNWSRFIHHRYHRSPFGSRLFHGLVMGLDRRDYLLGYQHSDWHREPVHERVFCHYRGHHLGNYSLVPVPATGQGIFRDFLTNFPFPFCYDHRKSPIILLEQVPSATEFIRRGWCDVQ